MMAILSQILHGQAMVLSLPSTMGNCNSIAVAATPPELRRDADSDAGRAGGAPRPLEGRSPGADRVDRLGLEPVGSPLRDVHVRRESRPRLPVDGEGVRTDVGDFGGHFGTI